VAERRPADGRDETDRPPLTASVSKRYAIVDETMLAEGAAKLPSGLLSAKPNRKVRGL